METMLQIWPGARAVRAFLVTLAIAFAVLLPGCSGLLPDTRSETTVSWGSFDEARAAIDRIVVYETRTADLAAMGLDPARNASVSLLTFSDVMLRFPAGTVLRSEDLDRGIRQCLTSGKRCSAYSVVVRKMSRERIGSFWLDSLNFRRETDVKGWSVNALIVLVDDLVVYTLVGGQPKIHEHELVRNPLGPLQLWGEQVPSLIR